MGIVIEWNVVCGEIDHAVFRLCGERIPGSSFSTKNSMQLI
jgi:hypothetical protein